MNIYLNTTIGGTDGENSFGGLQRLALIPKALIDTMTVAADGSQVTALTLETGEKFREVFFSPDGATFTDEYKVAGTDQFFEQVLNFTLKGQDAATISAGRKILLGRNYVAACQRASGEWALVGLSGPGLNATGGTASAVAEQNSRTFTLQSKNKYSAALIAASIIEPLIDSTIPA